MIKEMKPGKEKEEAIAEANEFRRKYADLLQWEQTLDYSMPREQIAKAFGKDNVLFFSGKESKGAKSKAVDVFNDDNSGKNIIVIQEASGKEGISLHDTTGNHQRVLITLGLPQSPITALQIEGRTYRIGNKSNAIFEYPILGLNSEMMLFGEKFNNQVSTTENLALGSQARNLRDSFANGVLEHSGIIPIDQQGVGGKKIDLSGHYDKIEDFFEDLRDVQIPDRIIDTQLKDMKKARSFKKELESIKGISVNHFEKNGISVFDKNCYRDYSIAFPGDAYSKERLRENYSKVYEQFDQTQQAVYSEHSKAALEEMKKLACKLADMSEDEMQKYISDRKNGGTHFREERGIQYSETDAKDVKNGRIIPEDVDKTVSSQIEKKFDDAVEKESVGLSEEENTFFKDVLDLKVREFSHLRASDIENQLKAYEYDYREWSTKFGGNGNGTNIVRRKATEYRAAAIAAEREMDYRKVRTDAIRDNYGLQGGGQATIDALARIFEKDNRGKQEVGRELFERASLLLKKVGTEISVETEAPEANKNALGSSGIHRDINLYIDTLARTSVKRGELATTILHEMIHQVANGAINLVKKGKAEGALTPKQIEAVNTILDIYNKVKDDKERFRENTYGLQNEYELTAQMADPRQRKAMDLSVWDRVANAAHELARKGDRSVLQRLKDAVKKLFEVSDKDKMDKAINDIMDDFNETIDDISMNEIDKDGFANSSVKLSDHAPIVVKHIANVAGKVGGKVNMVNSAEEVTNKRAKAAIEAGEPVTGWYDEKTGEVHDFTRNFPSPLSSNKSLSSRTAFSRLLTRPYPILSALMICLTPRL